MTNKLIKLIVLGLLLSSQAAPAFAHSGSGQPFVLINGDYVKSNPIAGSDPSLAQDLAPANYQVGMPIDFAVDYNVFGAPGYNFRWLWSKTDSSDGGKVTHSFKTSGTYVVTMQLQSGDDPAFNDIDTVAVNIVPKSDYKVPNATVAVEQIGRSKAGYRLSFKALPGSDPSTGISSFSWRFADGNTGQGQVVEHTYKNLEVDSRVFPALRVQDNNGLYTDLIFELDITAKGAVAMDSLIQGVVSNSKIASSAPASTGFLKFWPVLGLGVVALISLILTIAIKRAKRHTKPKL